MAKKLGLKIQLDNKSEIKNEFNAFIKELESKKIKLSFDDRALNGVRDKLNNFNKEFKSSTDNINDFNKSQNKMNDGFKNLSAIIGTMAIHKLFGEFKTGINHVVELDNSLNRISLTMNKSNKTFDNMGKTAIQYSKDINSTIADTTKALEIYANMNATIDEMLSKATPALLLSNLSGQNITKSSDLIQSIIYGFNEGVENAGEMVDVVSKLAANSAVDFGTSIKGITDAMTISSGVANQAGLDFKQFGAIITQLQETTRLGGSQIANGLTTIFSRLTKVSELSKEELSDLDKQFKSVGINIKKDSGELKGAWDILAAINEKWGTLNANEKSLVAQTAGSTRQKKFFIAMMENYNGILDKYSQTLDSNGFAMERNEVYANSFEAKIKQLNTTMSEFWNNNLHSDEMKNILTDLNKLLGVTGGFITKIGLVPTIVGGATLAFTLFNSKIRTSVTSINSFDKMLKTLRTTGVTKYVGDFNTLLGVMALEFKNGAASGGVFKGTMAGLKAMFTYTDVSAKLLQASVVALNVAFTMGLSFAITEIIKKFSELHKSQEELKEANQELISQVKENTSNNNELINYLQNEGKAYDELTKKTHLTKEEQEQLKEIKEKIKNNLPELISGYNAETGEIELQSKSTKELIELLKEKNKIENDKLIANGSDTTKVLQNDLKKIEKEKAQVQEEIDKLEKGHATTASGQYYHNANNINDLTEKLKTLDEGSKEYIETQKNIDSLNADREQQFKKMSTLANEENVAFKSYQPTVNAIINDYEDLNEVQKKLIQTSFKLKAEDVIKLEKGDFSSIMLQVEEIKKEIEESPEAKNIQLFSKLKEPNDKQVKECIDNVKTLAKKYNKDEIELAQELNIDIAINGEEKLDDLNDKLDEATEKAKELQDSMDSALSNVETYNKMLQEIGESGEISSSSMHTIIKNHAELIPYMNNQAALREKLIELVGKEKDAYSDAYTKMISKDNDYYNVKVKNSVDMQNKILDVYKKFGGKMGDGYSLDLKNYSNIEQAKLDMSKKLIKNLAGSWSKYWDATKMDFTDEFWYGMRWNPEEAKKMEEVREKYRAMMKSLDELVVEPIDFEGLGKIEEVGDKGSKAINKMEKAMSNTEKQMLKVEESLKRIQNQINKLDRQQEKLREHSKEYRDGLEKKIKLLEKENKLINEQKTLTAYLRDNPSERNSYDPEKGGSVAGNQIIQEAEKYLNTPYLWGGTTPDGFDCSGFVQYVYKQLGKEISRSTGTQFNEGTPVGRKDLQPGDLVFFGSDLHHVGIYAGNNQVIHSPQDNDVVKYSDIDAFGDYYGARRIIPSSGSGSSASGIRSSYSGAYATEINKAASAYGIDPNLLAAIAKVESNFNPNVTSHAGAMGMFQFMPGTAESFGVNPWDVQSSANGAAKYLKYLIDMFGGDLDKAILSYNGGQGNISRGIIPSETQAYLPKVKEAMASFGGSGYVSNNGTVSSVQAQYDYNGKIIDLNEKIEQNESNINKLRIEILESHLGEYEDKMKQIERIQEQYRIDVELSGEFNQTYINYLDLVLVKEKDKLKLYEEERAFIKQQLEAKVLDAKTLDMLSEKYKDLGTQMLNVRNESKKLGYEFAEAKMNAIQKLYNDNMNMISNRVEILQLNEEKNIKTIMQLNKQKVEQEEANIKRIQALMEELNQRSLTEPFYLDKLAEYNKMLEEANVKLEQHKHELEQVGEKIKNVFSPIESKIKEIITKNIELMKDAIDKNLKHVTDAIDKEIKALDDAQKRNSWNENKTSQANKVNELKRQIAELSADNSSEANSKRKDLQKQLQDELNKSKDMQMKHNADLKKEELNKQKQDLQSEAEKEKRDLEAKLDNVYLTLETKQALLDGEINDISGKRVQLIDALLEFENIFGSGLSLLGNQIKKELIDNLESAQKLLQDFDKKTGFDEISSNKTTKNVYGTAYDLEKAKAILGSQGYNYVDTSLVDVSKLKFDENSIILGGEGTHGGVNRTDLNGGIRLSGKDRYETENAIKLYAAIKSGKIKARNGIVYCSSQADIDICSPYLRALGYTQFVDLSKVKDINSLNIGDNDLIIGGSQISNNGTHLSGKDRYDTLNKVKDYTNKNANSIIDENLPKRFNGTVYGKSVDINNAKEYLNKYGYSFKETDDVRDINLKENDLIVGNGVMGKERIYNVGGQVLGGKNRQETEEEIRRFERKLRGLPKFLEGGVMDNFGLAVMHGDKMHSEVVFSSGDAKKLYEFIHNIPDNFLNSYSRFKMPESKTVNNNNQNPTVNIAINVDKMVADDKTDIEKLTREISRQILKTMGVGNMQ